MPSPFGVSSAAVRLKPGASSTSRTSCPDPGPGYFLWRAEGPAQRRAGEPLDGGCCMLTTGAPTAGRERD